VTLSANPIQWCHAAIKWPHDFLAPRFAVRFIDIGRVADFRAAGFFAGVPFAAAFFAGAFLAGAALPGAVVYPGMKGGGCGVVKTSGSLRAAFVQFGEAGAKNISRRRDFGWPDLK